MRTVRYPASARAALLWGFAAFVVLQLASALAVEFWWVSFRDAYYGPKAARLRHRMRGTTAPDGTPPVTIVMLGSSRTGDGLRGLVAEDEVRTGLGGTPIVVFNCGISGAGPKQEYLNLRRLLADGVRPDLLLVEVLPPLLDEQVGAAEGWIPADRLAHEDLSMLKRGGLPVEQLRAEWRGGWAIPWHTHRFAILSAAAPWLLPWQVRQDWAWNCDDSGWVPRPNRSPSANDRRRALEHACREYHATLASFHLGGLSCQALRKMLATCRSRNVPAALVLMPEGSEFRSWYPPAALAQLQAFLGELNRELGVPVIDARTWVADEDFVDSHHLLSHGAMVFSARLGREAILPWLRAREDRRAIVRE